MFARLSQHLHMNRQHCAQCRTRHLQVNPDQREAQRWDVLELQPARPAARCLHVSCTAIARAAALCAASQNGPDVQSAVDKLTAVPERHVPGATLISIDRRLCTICCLAVSQVSKRVHMTRHSQRPIVPHVKQLLVSVSTELPAEHRKSRARSKLVGRVIQGEGGIVGRSFTEAAVNLLHIGRREERESVDHG